MAWQKATNYGRPALIETAIGRYKHLTGPKLRARCPPGQQGEVALAVHGLNGMTRVDKPICDRVA